MRATRALAAACTPWDRGARRAVRWGASHTGCGGPSDEEAAAGRAFGRPAEAPPKDCRRQLGLPNASLGGTGGRAHAEGCGRTAGGTLGGASKAGRDGLCEKEAARGGFWSPGRGHLSMHPPSPRASNRGPRGCWRPRARRWTGGHGGRLPFRGPKSSRPNPKCLRLPVFWGKNSLPHSSRTRHASCPWSSGSQFHTHARGHWL